MPSLKAWRDLRKLPRELWILCGVTLVNRLGTMALPFLVLYLTRGLGFSAARAGVALATYGAVALVIGPVAGRFSDNWGALRMIEISLGASGVVLLLFPLAHSWAAVLSITALFAVANETFRAPNLALIGELGPPEYRKQAFALSRMAVNLGMSIGPAVGGFLAQRSFGLLFITDGATSLAAAAILAIPSFHSALRARELQIRGSRSGSDPSTCQPPRTPLLSAVFTDSDLRIFLLGILPVVIVFWQFDSTLPLFLVRDLHFRESAYGLLFTLNTLMIIALEVPLNSATAHWSHRRTLALGSLLFALGFGALALAHTYAAVAATVAIWTFGEMILFPGMSAYVSEIAPEGRRGEYMGLHMMTFNVGFAAGPWLGTMVLQRDGATVLWIAMLFIGMISVAILGRTTRSRRVVTA